MLRHSSRETRQIPAETDWAHENFFTKSLDMVRCIYYIVDVETGGFYSRCGGVLHTSTRDR